MLALDLVLDVASPALVLEDGVEGIGHPREG
jgi:hypothetical protein